MISKTNSKTPNFKEDKQYAGYPCDAKENDIKYIFYTYQTGSWHTHLEI
jgi:hypothetical protein